jgi:hypothetical protein
VPSGIVASALRHAVTFPLYLEVDEIYDLACPADPLPVRPGADNQNQRHGRHQDAGPDQTPGCEDPAFADPVRFIPIGIDRDVLSPSVVIPGSGPAMTNRNVPSVPCSM